MDKTTKMRILDVLEKNRGNFLSGSALAEMFSLSRTAIWKAVRTLQAAGWRIESRKHLGYRLQAEDDMLSEAAVRAALPDAFADIPLHIFPVIDSTNTCARQMAASGAPHGTLLLADEQTGGRGRSGKSFFSPAKKGLYMSLILRPNEALTVPAQITIAAAVDVCRAVETLTGLAPKIKWVNDLYLNGRKICGILTESIGEIESGRIETLVVGIGLNIALAPEDLPDELRVTAGSIGRTDIPRARFAGEIAGRLLSRCENFADVQCLNEYRARSLVLGQHVSFMHKSAEVSGVAEAVDSEGRLLVRMPNESLLTLSSGEISLCSFPKEI